MSDNDMNNSSWERDTINKLAFAALGEQKRARRWNILFRSLFMVWLFSFLIILIASPGAQSPVKLSKSHTALIDIKGVIAADSDANADNVVTALREAFENKHSKAVIMRINSPGGSPVQAGYINDEIIRLRNKYPDKKLYAVITDLCASGGYYIAAGADKIYADKASIVGSIGVIMNGFGFTGSMDKLGVERRLITAGQHKGFLDPFSSLKDDEVVHARKLLDNIHEQFINVVKNGRGKRLADDDKLFSGYVWTGEKSIELGLVDALGSSSYVAREVVGEEEIVDYTVKATYLERFAERFGAAMGESAANVLGVNALQLK
jgi:protease-4